MSVKETNLFDFTKMKIKMGNSFQKQEYLQCPL